jgi:hypothetical protein
LKNKQGIQEQEVDRGQVGAAIVLAAKEPWQPLPLAVYFENCFWINYIFYMSGLADKLS